MFATNYAPQTNCTLRFRKPSEKKYCDSYDCPYGYDLVDDADDVECKKGECTESQCCKKVCVYYKCPNYCTPKSGSDKIKCDYSGCTTDKCCDYKCESSLYRRLYCLSFDVQLPVSWSVKDEYMAVDCMYFVLSIRMQYRH